MKKYLSEQYLDKAYYWYKMSLNENNLKYHNQEKLIRTLNNKFQDLDIWVINKGDDGIFIQILKVPENKRLKGKGTLFMEYIIKYADEIGSILYVDPSSDFGGNVNRLKRFYKRFGFVENKDFTYSYRMIRYPK